MKIIRMVRYYKSQCLFISVALVLCLMCLALVVSGPVRKFPKVEKEEGGLLNDVLLGGNHAGAADGALKDSEVEKLQQHQQLHRPHGLDDEIDVKFENALKLVGGGKLDAKQLEPADHLDVVKMEHDGHVNREYHKEMFLGEEHEEFKSHPVDRAEGRLKEIVAKADLDEDGSLSQPEMEKWIAQKMKEHFDEAKRENEHIFKHLDPDGDGFIKWKEYYVHFLLSRGFDMDSALQHVQNSDGNVGLKQADEDALVSYKFRWADADNNPSDNELSKEEFMVFRHPEHSQQSLDNLVMNVLRGLDANNDNIVTEEEFSALPPGEVENEEYRKMDLKWQAERKQEFRETMDLDHNGKVDKKELRNYLDPTNPLQAKLEADSLISLIDDDKNGLLSMGEILKHSDLFISSKVVNLAANMHEEL
ncbi:hypothetical protein EGW08_012592 [Elysia chlorotica]|uniref:45 kDa calcium-binding protein n=1 Tax=Elysia chlorotica TaxID=188477 RepID=A0A3S0ZIG1_ELYCH|nr:hypothetical protein EGW08_012592 [Elysia chlorotica]